jgi:hypothetical protein
VGDGQGQRQEQQQSQRQSKVEGKSEVEGKSKGKYKGRPKSKAAGEGDRATQSKADPNIYGRFSLAAATRFESSDFAFSSSARWVEVSPLPARLM